MENETVTNENTETETVETQGEVKQPSKTELLRELSKEHGVNLFDPEGIQKFKEYQDAQKTEHDKLQETIKGYESKEQEWTSKQFEYESKLASFKLGIKDEYVNDAVALAKNYVNDSTDFSTALKTVVDKYPSFTGIAQEQEVRIGTQQTQSNPKGLTEQEAYMQKLKSDPKYKRYVK